MLKGFTEVIQVLFIHQAAELYGSDKVLLYLVSGMVQRGQVWPIVVLPCKGPLWDALVAAGVEVHVGEIAKIRRSVFSPVGMLRLLRQAWMAIRQLDAIVAGRDVAVVHSNTLAVLAGAVWAWRRRVPHLWHVHEIILSPRLIGRLFPRMVYRGADLVMSNSTLTERWLLGEQPRLAGRSVVVFNGLPEQTPATVEEVAHFRALTKARPGDVVVMLAGRLNHWKGQGLLIEAASLLRQRGQSEGLHFVVLGDTAPGQESLRAQLLEKVDAAGLGAVFTFIPFVNDIRPAWQSADIAVVPSTEPEPFGMVAIEAMAAGLPVVAAGHGGLLDIVEHGETGLLFEPRQADALATAIHSLAIDASKREQLGRAGRQRQRERFSADSQVRSTELAYGRLVDPTAARAH